MHLPIKLVQNLCQPPALKYLCLPQAHLLHYLTLKKIHLLFHLLQLLLNLDATYLSPVSLTTGPIEEDLQSPMILESLPSSHQEVASTCLSSLSLSASLEENPPALLSATILAQSVSSSHQEACLSPVNFSQSMSTDGSPTFLPNTPTSTPSLANSMSTSFLIEAKCKEKKWVEHALALLDKGELNRGDYIGWAAYHASQQPSTNDPRCLCALLPLFFEKAATFAMIKHGMDVQRKAIQYLNPGQIPVTTFDQPLYALAKLVQWKWPVTYGESVYVVLLGGLHIEMALWNTLGDLLEASGWTTALTEAEVASPGTADSFLKVSHLTRTRHAHQVTFLTLKRLQKEAFLCSESCRSEANWQNEMLVKSPTFMFWDLILRYESLILIFVQAHREKNFSLYIEVAEELTPLFFALDHVNYSRWMPVHIWDMKHLPKPIKNELDQQHHWVILKSN